MRADRLISLLLLLQTRGRMTAQALADELEVSVRTVYRDLDALSSAGVPLYAEAGPGGGCALLDNYHTHLTGLEEAEVRALLMGGMPAALAELGFGADLKTALLKLLAALPAERRHDEQWVRARVYLDWERWQTAPHPGPQAGRHADDRPHRTRDAEPPLHVVRRAVWEDRRLWIAYRRASSFYRREFERLVEPYGLVAKEGEWHLLCADAPDGAERGEGADRAHHEDEGRIRVFRVAELLRVTATGETFARPEDFDLPRAWRAWCAQVRAARRQYVVTARVTPQLAADLPLYLGEHVGEDPGEVPGEKRAGDPSLPTASAGDDWLSVVFQFDSLEEARTKLLGLGAGVEVMTPIALRRSLLDYAEQVVKRYSRH